MNNEITNMKLFNINIKFIFKTFDKKTKIDIIIKKYHFGTKKIAEKKRYG